MVAIILSFVLCLIILGMVFYFAQKCLSKHTKGFKVSFGKKGIEIISTFYKD